LNYCYTFNKNAWWGCVLLGSKYVIPLHNVTGVEFYDSFLLSYNNDNITELPVPSGVCDDSVKDYANYLTLSPKTVTVVHDCLRLADVIGDRNVFKTVNITGCKVLAPISGHG